MKKRVCPRCGNEIQKGESFCRNCGNVMPKDTFNKLGYKAKINTHTTSYIN